MATILKLTIKNLYPNCQHYTDIDPRFYRKKIFNPLDSSQRPASESLFGIFKCSLETFFQLCSRSIRKYEVGY
jgi:hypothetical protein